MRTTPQIIALSRINVIATSYQNNQRIAKHARRSLTFFGTTSWWRKKSLVTFGSACARILTALSTNPSNDNMEVLRSGSLFSDILQEVWRHQLGSYRIISFYEGIGEVRE